MISTTARSGPEPLSRGRLGCPEGVAPWPR